MGVDLTGFIAAKGLHRDARPPLGPGPRVRGLPAGAGLPGGKAPRAVALVTCDLIGLGRHLVGRVRRRVAGSGFGGCSSCSHTHAGPETGVLTTIGMHQAYLASLERGLGDAVERARLTSSRCACTWGQRGSRRAWPSTGSTAGWGSRSARPGRSSCASSPWLPWSPSPATPWPWGRGSATPARTSWPPCGSWEAAGGGPLLGCLNGCGGDVNPGMDSRGPQACEDLGRGLAPRAREALAGAPPPRRREEQSVGGLQVGCPLLATPPLPRKRRPSLGAGRERLAAQTPGSPLTGGRVTEVGTPCASAPALGSEPCRRCRRRCRR